MLMILIVLLPLQADPTVPLFGFIGRLEEQKGVDILFESLPKVLPKADIQVAVLGTGVALAADESEYHLRGTWNILPLQKMHVAST